MFINIDLYTYIYICIYNNIYISKPNAYLAASTNHERAHAMIVVTGWQMQ